MKSTLEGGIAINNAVVLSRTHGTVDFLGSSSSAFYIFYICFADI
jgi:hypothetical protein